MHTPFFGDRASHIFTRTRWWGSLHGAPPDQLDEGNGVSRKWEEKEEGEKRKRKTGAREEKGRKGIEREEERMEFPYLILLFIGPTN